MKKLFAKILCLGMFLAVLAPAAKADTISGSVSIAGQDTFTNTSITFTPTTGLVLASTIAGVSSGNTAALTSFAFASATGTQLFSIVANGLTTTFTISNLLTTDYTAATATTAANINITGTGIFAQTGMTSSTGRFSLTSSTTGLTSFQLVGTTVATPEPNSLMLLGTGLVSAAGMLVRRRRAGMTI